MKKLFAVPTINKQLCTHFGHCVQFALIETNDEEITNTEYLNPPVHQPGEARGAGPKAAQELFEINPDVLITGNGPGGNAAAVLKKTGIKIFTEAVDMTVKEAFEACNSNSLKEF